MGRHEEDDGDVGRYYPSIPMLPDGVSLEDFAAALDITYDEMLQRQQFIDAIALGTDPLLAGLEVGWSLTKAKRIAVEMREIVDMAQNVVDLRISRVVAELALDGHEWAVKLWLFNRRPDLFKDVRHIEVKHGIELPAHVIAETREQVRERVREVIMAGGVAELQQPIIDAEVIE